MTLATAHEQVREELRAAEKLLLVTHENPDGAWCEHAIASAEELLGD